MNATLQIRRSCSMRPGECCFHSCGVELPADVCLISSTVDCHLFVSPESSPLRQKANPSSSQRTWSVCNDSRRLCMVRFNRELRILAAEFNLSGASLDVIDQLYCLKANSSVCHPQWRKSFPMSLSPPLASAGSCTPSLSTHSMSEKVTNKEQ